MNITENNEDGFNCGVFNLITCAIIAASITFFMNCFCKPVDSHVKILYLQRRVSILESQINRLLQVESPIPN